MIRPTLLALFLSGGSSSLLTRLSPTPIGEKVPQQQLTGDLREAASDHCMKASPKRRPSCLCSLEPTARSPTCMHRQSSNSRRPIARRTQFLAVYSNEAEISTRSRLTLTIAICPASSSGLRPEASSIGGCQPRAQRRGARWRFQTEVSRPNRRSLRSRRSQAEGNTQRSERSNRGSAGRQEGDSSETEADGCPTRKSAKSPIKTEVTYAKHVAGIFRLPRLPPSSDQSAPFSLLTLRRRGQARVNDP